MKKIFAIVLTLALVMSMSTVAFAADDTLTDGTTTSEHEVSVKVSNTASDVAVISVDVTYGDLQFTYVTADAGTWNPDEHIFDVAEDGTWLIDGDNTVVVTNHSNRDVEVAVSAEKAETETGDLAIAVANGEDTLTNGVVNGYADADSLTATITVSGTPTTQDSDYAAVGKVIVSITPTDSITNAYN